MTCKQHHKSAETAVKNVRIESLLSIKAQREKESLVLLTKARKRLCLLLLLQMGYFYFRCSSTGCCCIFSPAGNAVKGSCLSHRFPYWFC